MSLSDSNPTLRDESAARWHWLEDEPDACVVVSERMELVYLNAVGRALVPDGWFGKRCFEVLPVVDETCAFHCPKIRDVNESHDIVYCEEIVRSVGASQDTFGIGLIPLGPRGDDRAHAVLLMRRKDGVHGEHDEQAFQRDLLRDSEQVRRRIETRLDPSA